MGPGNETAQDRQRQIFFQNLWAWKARNEGAEAYDRPMNDGMLPIESVEDEVRSCLDVFVGYMYRRLVLGAYRYGPVKTARRSYNNLKAIHARTEAYDRTGNLDYLFDVANMALLEFFRGKHPNAHLNSAEHSMTTEEIGYEEGTKTRGARWESTRKSYNKSA